MAQLPPYLSTPDQQPDAMQVLGTQVKLISDGSMTPGFAVTHQSGDATMGPPPHSHDWDELFYVIAGSVDFICNGQKSSCSAGSLIFVPAGQVHGFQYGLKGGEMLEITGNGSKAPAMFTSIDAEIPPGPPNIPQVIDVLGRYGVTIHA
jgi:quercetin dioxygenase-like cupin family protein